jgi:hypothetical protein
MKILIQSLYITLLFFIHSLALADTVLPKADCAIDLHQMPQYQVTFSFPMQDVEQQYLVLRFYQPWGDGGEFGWQTDITPPSVTLDGRPLRVNNAFSYHSWGADFGYGAMYLGYDQYAQYFQVNLPYGIFNSDSKLVITGTFQQVAYLSAVMYSSGVDKYIQQGIVDKEIPTVAGACNPYQSSHPSVFAYPTEFFSTYATPANAFSLDKLTKIKNGRLENMFKNISPRRSGEIPVYRLDKETSLNVVADGVPASDGCSNAYLMAQKSSSQEVLILRIKVPNTFIDNNHPDKIFHNYHASYFSVGSHRMSYNSDDPNDILLSYWGVNARMLNKFKDKEGYAYVFFAPNSYTNNIAIEQHTQPTQPPVITWGNYKGYLLGEPDFAVILRYRDPNIQWEGSPENARCYPTSTDNKPIAHYELGDYTPEIFGDTLDNFLNGKIGAVSKDTSWPIK